MPELNRNGKLDRFFAYLTRYRFNFLVIVVAITVAVASGTAWMKSEVILSDLFAYDHPFMKLSGKFSKIFGGGGTAAVIAVSTKKGDIFNVKTLKKVKGITDEIVLWNEVYRQLTNSMATQTTKVVRNLAKGEIAFEALMFPSVPESQEEIEQLKKNIFSNSAYNGALVSYDGKAALIITEFKEDISYGRAFDLLMSVVERYSDENTSVHVTGFPMLMGWIYSYKTQMRAMFAVSVGLMLLILLVIFRNFTGILAPMIVGTISTGIGLGFVGWIGINFSPLIYVLAFLVGARIVSHSVQITHRYFEELNASNGNKDEACFKTMRAMFIPNVAGVVTDAAGFMVLFFAKVVLMQQIAIIMTFWMMSISLLAIITPIMCTYMPQRAVRESLTDKGSKSGILDRINMAMAGFSIGYGRYVLILILAALVAFSGWQATRLKIGDPSPGSSLLWEKHPYNRDQGFINDKFKASSETYVLYYDGEPGSVYDPEVNTMFEKFDQHMAESLPDIYKSSMSILSMARMLNLMYHDGDEVWNELPRKEEELTEILGQVRMKLGPATQRRYMDEELKLAQMTLFFADHTSDNILRVKEAANEFFKNNPTEVGQGEFKLAGGGIGQEIALNEEMLRSHAVIDSAVFLVIFIMCALAFRSLLAGIMLTIPLLIANLSAYAYMSLMGIGLSINSLPVAAVAVGVGVDFAIYLYSRCLEEYPSQKDLTKTIMVAVSTCGTAIVYTGTVIILAILPWYLFSALKFQAQMGFFLSLVLLVNLILSLTLHPFMIMLIKPKFIKKRAKALGAEA